MTDDQYQQLKRISTFLFEDSGVKVFEAHEANKHYTIKCISKNNKVDMDEKDEEPQIVCESLSSLRREAQVVRHMSQRTNQHNSTGMCNNKTKQNNKK